MPFIQVFQKIFDHLFQNVHLKKSIQNCSLFPKPDRNIGKGTLKKNVTKNKDIPPPNPFTWKHKYAGTRFSLSSLLNLVRDPKQANVEKQSMCPHLHYELRRAPAPQLVLRVLVKQRNWKVRFHHVRVNLYPEEWRHSPPQPGPRRGQGSPLWLILGEKKISILPTGTRNSGMPSAVTVMPAIPEQTLFPDSDNVPVWGFFFSTFFF